jgi:hypothetical protein
MVSVMEHVFVVLVSYMQKVFLVCSLAIALIAWQTIVEKVRRLHRDNKRLASKHTTSARVLHTTHPHPRPASDARLL